MLTQSADTADDERNILIGAPNRPPMIAPKASDGCYGLASALGADVGRAPFHVRYGQKRTSVLFDHLIGLSQQCRRHRDP